jgi:putative ABC transport system permease protein
MDTLVQDVRYALATMRRNRGFAAAAVLTLALGIGATTAVFSVVDGVLLRPLPYPSAERLVRLSEEHPGAASPLRQPMLSNLTYYAWSAGSRALEHFAAYRFQQYTVGLAGGAARVTGSAVTPSLLTLLGQTPAVGRLFHEGEGAEGNDRFVVLSDRGWRELFAADPAVIGRGLTVDGKPAQVIGVTRPGFSFPDRDALMWTPMEVLRPSPDAVAGRRGRMNVINALARLRPEATAAQAEAEGTAAARGTIRPMAANLLFGVGGPPVAHVRGVVAEMTARVRPALLVLAAGVLCVLLIVCANVANLFLSRGVARQRELAVRAAIGASRGRLGRQLLTESAVVAAIGGALGIALARLLVGATPLVAARNFPRLAEVVVDGRVVGFAVVATVLTALASGLVPALRGARCSLSASLHGGDGASAGGFRGPAASRLRDALLASEAAFAVMLIVAAVLLARSFVRLVNVDAGYSADHVLAAEIFVPAGDAPDKADAMRATVDAVVHRTRALPGVIAAGAANMMPLDSATQIAGFPVPWDPGDGRPASARALIYTVTPGYAEALRLRLAQGRLFQEADVASAIRPWIVNEEFARLYLPPSPVGYRWTVPLEPPAPPQTREIVGVVANVLKNGNDSTPQPEVYTLPAPPGRFFGRFEVVARTATDPAASAPAVRQIVREVDPNAAVETVTLAQRLSDSFDEPRFGMTVLIGFSALAALLASIGLYGVLSYSVTERRRELGVRAALGASRSALVRLVVGEGLRSTALGIGLGLVAAAAVTRWMRAALFGVAPLDPVSFAIAPIVLVPVALLACLLPASRAASADPAEVLRCD